MQRHRLVSILLLLWAVFIIYGTTIPFDFRFDQATAAQGWADAQRHAFSFVGPNHSSRTDVVSNVLLFSPLGFLAFLLARERGNGRFRGLFCAVAGGLALSLAVESLQLFSPLRTSSANDLFTNGLGAGFGAVAGWIWNSWGRKHTLPWLQAEAETHPYRLLASSVVVVWLLAGALPYNFSLDVDDLKRALKGARLIPFGGSFSGAPVPNHPLAWLADLARFSVLGGFLAWACDREGRPRTGMGRIALATGVATLTAFCVELGQLVVVGRGTDLSVVVLAFAGALLGASWMQTKPTARRAAAAGLVAWLVVLAVDRLAPFVWAPPHAADWGWRHWLPFLPYFQRLGLGALADLLREAGMGVPLGLLCAALQPRRSPRWVGLEFFLVGFALEAGQLFLPQRTADLTDALSLGLGATLGVVLGHILATRARASFAGQTPAPSAKI